LKLLALLLNLDSGLLQSGDTLLRLIGVEKEPGPPTVRM
jgi:hypothetical protein